MKNSQRLITTVLGDCIAKIEGFKLTNKFDKNKHAIFKSIAVAKVCTYCYVHIIMYYYVSIIKYHQS